MRECNMTKIEKNLVDKFFLSVIRHKNRKFVNAKIFNKRAKLGLHIAVVPIKDLITEYKKLVSKVGK